MGLFDIFKNKKDNLTEEIDEYNTGQDEKKIKRFKKWWRKICTGNIPSVKSRNKSTMR